MTTAFRRPIIGVMGSYKVGTPETASWIGAAITEAGGILLTGGKPSNKVGSTVKDGATCGALDAATVDAPARMISILPTPGVNPRTRKTPPDSHCRVGFRKFSSPVKGFWVRTPLSSWERDLITGAVPDVLIALDGNTGTLAEVAFAAFFGVPIFFVDTTTQLRTARESRDFTSTIKAAVEFFQTTDPLVTSAAVIDALTTTLARSASITLDVPSFTAAAAVLRSVVLPALPPIAPTVPTRFPQFPNDRFAKSRFDTLVAEI